MIDKEDIQMMVDNMRSLGFTDEQINKVKAVLEEGKRRQEFDAARRRNEEAFAADQAATKMLFRGRSKAGGVVIVSKKSGESDDKNG